MTNHGTIAAQLGVGQSRSVKDPPDISGVARLTRPPSSGMMIGVHGRSGAAGSAQRDR